MSVQTVLVLEVHANGSPQPGMNAQAFSMASKGGWPLDRVLAVPPGVLKESPALWQARGDELMQQRASPSRTLHLLQQCTERLRGSAASSSQSSAAARHSTPAPEAHAPTLPTAAPPSRGAAARATPVPLPSPSAARIQTQRAQGAEVQSAMQLEPLTDTDFAKLSAGAGAAAGAGRTSMQGKFWELASRQPSREDVAAVQLSTEQSAALQNVPAADREKAMLAIKQVVATQSIEAECAEGDSVCKMSRLRRLARS